MVQRIQGRLYLGVFLSLALAGAMGMLRPAIQAEEEAYEQAQALFEQLQRQPQTQTTLAQYRRVIELATAAAQQHPNTETAVKAQDLIVTCCDLLRLYPERTKAALALAEALAAVRGPEPAAARLLELAKTWSEANDVETRRDPNSKVVTRPRYGRLPSGNSSAVGRSSTTGPLPRKQRKHGSAWRCTSSSVLLHAGKRRLATPNKA